MAAIVLGLRTAYIVRKQIENSLSMALLVAFFGLIKGVVWPCFAFYVAWLFLNDIAQALPALAGRVTKVGLEGVELAAPNDQKGAPKEDRAKEVEILAKKPEAPPSAAVLSIEAGLLTSLEAFSELNRLDVLLRNLAETRGGTRSPARLSSDMGKPDQSPRETTLLDLSMQHGTGLENVDV